MVLKKVIHYLKNPETSTILPTTQETIEQICDMMNFDTRKVIVEYGPGLGGFTEEIKKRMTHDSKLAAIEVHPPYVQGLQHLADERVSIHQRSAEDVKQVLTSIGETQADIVLSGIPLTGNLFFKLPKNVKEKILRDTYDVLKPDGTLFVYQVMKKVRKDLEQWYPHIEEIPAIGRDFPPLTIFKATKR